MPEPQATTAAPPPTTSPGTSDGVTCEEARAAYVEEIDMGKGSSPDLSAEDFARVLNSGAYLAKCDVPSTSKAMVCVAVKNGSAVGVTVSLEPASPELELCVAKEVRSLSFAVHPKMDIVHVTF